MLFAIDDDPEEAKNLATDPAYQNVLVSLRKVSAVLTEIEPFLSYSIAKRGDQFGSPVWPLRLLRDLICCARVEQVAMMNEMLSWRMSHGVKKTQPLPLPSTIVL
eukprot:COSAG06_NODE_4415_length_4288_cov_2.513965_2_plen_105_part_00